MKKNSKQISPKKSPRPRISLKKSPPPGFTMFSDAYSGGGTKEKWELIIIEAPEEEAKIIFYNRFGHSPNRVSCTCCGEDYSIYHFKTLGEIYKAQWKVTGDSLKEFLKNPKVCLIKSSEIKKEERVGEVPAQGYVWVG